MILMKHHVEKSSKMWDCCLLQIKGGTLWVNIHVAFFAGSALKYLKRMMMTALSAQMWITSPVWILLLGKNTNISYFIVLPSKIQLSKISGHKITIIFLPNNLNICFGCSKEPSHWDLSLECQQQLFWLRNKKNNLQLQYHVKVHNPLCSLQYLFKKWIQFLDCSWNHEYFGSLCKVSEAWFIAFIYILLEISQI